MRTKNAGADTAGVKLYSCSLSTGAAVHCSARSFTPPICIDVSLLEDCSLDDSAEMERIREMDVEEFCEFLVVERALHPDLKATFSENRVSGAVFLDLTEEDLKELVPVLGDRTKVRKLLQETKEVSETFITIISQRVLLLLSLFLATTTTITATTVIALGRHVQGCSGSTTDTRPNVVGMERVPLAAKVCKKRCH